MDRWMDVDRWILRCRDDWIMMHEWIEDQMKKLMDGLEDECMNGCIDGWMLKVKIDFEELK